MKANGAKGTSCVPSSTSTILTFEIDSDASDHFVNTLHGVSDFDPTIQMEVELADRSTLRTAGVGRIGNKLSRVHYVPTFGSCLLSASRLREDNKGTVFWPNKPTTIIDTLTNTVLAEAYERDSSWCVDIIVDPTSSPSATACVVHKPTSTSTTITDSATLPRSDASSKIQLWARRLGFPCASRLFELHHGKHVTGLDLPVRLTLADIKEHIEDEDVRALAKSHAQPHRASTSPRTTSPPFSNISVDIKGPFEVASIGGRRYAAIIVCHSTRYKIALPLHSKSDLLSALKRFHGQFVRSRGFQLRTVRWDNAGENKNAAVDSWLTQIGARPQYTSAHSSASNGIAERAIQTISSTAKALRIGGSFPKRLWAECFKTAVHLENLLPSRSNIDNKSSYELLHGKSPNISYLRTIGCACFVHVHAPTRLTLDPQAVHGKLVGYGETSRTYRVLLDNGCSIVESAHVTFAERLRPGDILQSLPGTLPMAPDVESLHFEPTAVDASGFTSIPLRASAPGFVPSSSSTSGQPRLPTSLPLATSNRFAALANDPDDDDDGLGYLLEEDLLNPDPSSEDEPLLGRGLRSRRPNTLVGDIRGLPPGRAKRTKRLSYHDAKANPLLRTSMVDELTHLLSSKAVEIVDLPPDRRPIGCTWAHKLKTDSDGQFTRAKSRVCPLGFQQRAGLDFCPDSVASPTLGLFAVMMMLCLVVNRGMCESVLDVDSAFTIPTLQEKVYMRFPEGMKPQHGKVLLLNHSLNGLKQSGYNWHVLAHKFLTEQGLLRSNIDTCFYHRWDAEKLILVGLYVDDFRVAADSQIQIDELVTAFRAEYPIKVQSPEWWLGMKIVHDRVQGTMLITQEAYVDAMLTRFNMQDCGFVDTPAAPGTKLERTPLGEIDEEARKFPYREAVGALLWLARCSRPDILYAVNQLGAHCSNPNSIHVSALKRCLRYVKTTKHLGLTFRKGGGDPTVEAYSDSDFAGEPQVNEKPMYSLSGSLVRMVDVGAIFWMSSLQSTLSTSTFESEYRSSGTTAKSTATARNLLTELGFPQPLPSTVWEDNQACIAMTNSAICSSKARHIKIDHHYVREQVANGEIKLKYCPTKEMVADIFTKALDLEKFQYLRAKLLG